jgi:hypothetical protein
MMRSSISPSLWNQLIMVESTNEYSRLWQVQVASENADHE